MKLIKKLLFFGVIISVFFGLSSPLIANSQGQSDLKNPGISPDSFWYFGEIIKERIFLIFTFDKTEKIEKYLDYSNERISEALTMIEAEKPQEAIVALDEYISLMRRAEGTANLMDREQLEKIKYEANQETGNQNYHLRK
jgi:hypothetical protein